MLLLSFNLRTNRENCAITRTNEAAKYDEDNNGEGRWDVARLFQPHDAAGDKNMALAI